MSFSFGGGRGAGLFFSAGSGHLLRGRGVPGDLVAVPGLLHPRCAGRVALAVDGRAPQLVAVHDAEDHARGERSDEDDQEDAAHEGQACGASAGGVLYTFMFMHTPVTVGMSPSTQLPFR